MHEQQIWGLCQRSFCLAVQILKRLSCKSMAAPSQVDILAQGHKITPFKRSQSTMTRIESYPSTGGRSVIKSIEQ